MNTFVELFAFVCAVGIQGSASAQNISSSLGLEAVRAEWSSYKEQYGKRYSTAHLDNHRMAVFLENMRTIEEHNTRFHQGLVTFELGLNELTDLTLEEVRSTYMSVRIPNNYDELQSNVSLHVTSTGYAYPRRLDWRDRGAVTPVKHQGQCGSCYAFSAIGAIETAHWRKHRKLIDISEQDAVDCTRHVNGGCNGGWMPHIFEWMKTNGYVATRAYPYQAKEGPCRHQVVPKIGRIASHVRIPYGDEKALMDAVTYTGTVAVCYNHKSQQHTFYRRGIIDDANCPGEVKDVTHAVTLVGYGTENGIDYWTLKNSWGTGWGEGGYFRMRRGKNMCGIANWASYPVSA